MWADCLPCFKLLDEVSALPKQEVRTTGSGSAFCITYIYIYIYMYIDR